MEQKTIHIRGVPITFDAIDVIDQRFVITGRWLKVASLGQEGGAVWTEDVNDPARVIEALGSSPVKIDLFRFRQRIPDSQAKFSYRKEWKYVAAIPISTYKHWWEKQVTQKVRNKVRKARKQGVVVNEVAFSDEFVREIMAIFNEYPVRQGLRFWHYGKDFETVKREMGQDLRESVFLGAYLQGELIGFMKLFFADRYAMITVILDKLSYRDKAPMNIMIEKAIEVCIARRAPFLTYMDWRRGDLAKFQKSNGFEKIPVPEYFVPLTWKARMALLLRLHKGFKALVPAWATRPYLVARAKYYAIKYPQNPAKNKLEAVPKP